MAPVAVRYSDQLGQRTDDRLTHTAGVDLRAMGLGFTYPPFAALVLTPLAIGQVFGRFLMTVLSGIALLVAGQLCVRAVRPNWSTPHRAAAGLLLSCVGLVLEPTARTFGLG